MYAPVPACMSACGFVSACSVLVFSWVRDVMYLFPKEKSNKEQRHGTGPLKTGAKT